MQETLFIVFVFLNHVLGKIIIGPQHAESTVGGKVILNCITDYTSVSDPLEWRYKPEPTVLFEPIYTSGYIVNGFYERFSVKGDHVKGEYHMAISNVSMTDAGIYTCADMEGDTRKAELVVWEIFPSDNSCRIEAPSDGIIGSNSCGLPPDTVRLSCNMKYRGNIVPMMQWRELGGNVITEGVYNEVVNGNTVSTLVLNGNLIQSRKYTCAIVYTNPTLQSSYSWTGTTKTLQIEDVRDVTTIGCDQQILNCSSGRIHSCTYRWIDGNNNSDSGAMIDLRNKPNGRYICISDCRLRGVICPIVKTTIDRQCSTDARNQYAITAVVISIVTSVGLLIGLLVTRLVRRFKGPRNHSSSSPWMDYHAVNGSDIEEPEQEKVEFKPLLRTVTDTAESEQENVDSEPLLRTMTEKHCKDQGILFINRYRDGLDQQVCEPRQFLFSKLNRWNGLK